MGRASRPGFSKFRCPDFMGSQVGAPWKPSPRRMHKGESLGIVAGVGDCSWLQDLHFGGVARIMLSLLLLLSLI